MQAKLIFAPVLAQVALTIVMYLRLAKVKDRARTAPSFDGRRAALHVDAWPDEVLKVSNNINNQFESPVLFYALSLMLFAMDRVDAISLGMASAFVLLRIVHAVIHTTSNRVKNRRMVFTIGTTMLLGLWAHAVVGVVS